MTVSACLKFIPENLTAIPPKRTAFFPVRQLTIKEGTKKIAENAVKGFGQLEKLSLPESLTTIGNFAFSGCKGLTTIAIPAGVTEIGDESFSYCIGIQSFSVADGNPAFCEADGVLYNKDKTTLIRYPAAKPGTAFVLPETVTSIAENAFADNHKLTEIVIPDRVKSLGAGCFARCKNLKTAVCGNGAVALPDRMFKDCPALSAVTVPYGVDRIGKEAFSGCAALATVTMSNDMGMIGEDAFKDCKGLDDVFFNGTADEWTAIGVKEGNNALSGARKHFGAVLTPLAVTGVEVVKIGDSSVTLQWKAARGATEYRVYSLNADTQTYELLATVTQTPCEIEGLTPETAYALAVEAAAVTAKKTLTAEKSDPVPVNTTKPETPADAGQAPGDVDGDGRITAADARLALRASVGLKGKDDVTEGSAGYLACDVNGDGKVGSDDARLILRASVGLEDASKFGKKA